LPRLERRDDVERRPKGKPMITTNSTLRAPAAGAPQTLALQGLVNRFMRGVLRTPGLSRLAGRRLIVLYVVGRTSGRRYSIPVAYTAEPGGVLLIGSPFGWIRNLRTGVPVELRLRGRRREANVEVLTAEPDVVAHYARMCRDNPQFAKFNRIGSDADGNPRPADLHAAWAAGARAVRLTPR
jgi:deazaflavin-dependent oxidoreductase (nitroreductase family)